MREWTRDGASARCIVAPVPLRTSSVVKRLKMVSYTYTVSRIFEKYYMDGKERNMLRRFFLLEIWKEIFGRFDLI